jgi:ABC-type glycerol-3-phosphate transport system substrate-binding protein
MLTFLTDYTSAPMRALAEQIVCSWNERHPDSPVTLATLDHEELRSVRSVPSADVVAWPHGLADPSLMLDVSSLWTCEEIASGYPAQSRALAAHGGYAYFLPTTRYWWAMYYRPSLLASAGIDVPIETWDGLLAAFESLRAAGIAPVALGNRHLCPAAAWFDYLNMRINGPSFHRDLMALRETYTDERVRAVFAFWRRLIDDGVFLADPAEYDEQDAVRAVQRGTAGMTFIGAYVGDEYLQPGDGDLGLFRFPVIRPDLPVGEDSPVDGFYVTKTTALPDDALAFLAFLGSRAVQLLTVKALNVLPTRTDVNLDDAAPHVASGAEIIARADRLMRFYDVDTPPDMAAAGKRAFASFLRSPARIEGLLEELESIRKETHVRTGALRRDSGP